MGIDSHVFGSADFNAQDYLQRYWQESSSSEGSIRGNEGENESESEGSMVRRTTSGSGIEGLRGDLLLHLRDLRLQLIELINRDYADFINLSTNLVGVDKALEQLRGPLQSLAGSVKSTQEFFQETIDTLEQKLEDRAAFRQKKAILQLFLNILESVKKVEDLLFAPESLNADKGEGSSGQQIERVAGEFNQLQFYVSQGASLPLVANLAPRFAKITNTLQKSLEGAFTEGLRTNNLQNLTQCLRTYSLIDRKRQVEDLFRRDVVAPFMRKNVTLEALEKKGSSVPENLSTIFAAILRFITTGECMAILAITKNTIKGTGYDILTNAIWPEVTDSLKALTPIFNPGNPEVFHKEFEKQSASRKNLLNLRSSQAYVDFMQRWQQRQLPIYYQIRFKEISTSTEEVLSNTSLLINAKPSSVPAEFSLPSTSTIFAAIQRCWAPEVFLFGLVHRFWKLTLQLLARYHSWLLTLLPEKRDLLGDVLAEKPVPQSVESPVVATDPTKPELTIENAAIIVHDIALLSTKTTEFFHTNIAPTFAQLVPKLSLYEDSLQESLAEVRDDAGVFLDFISKTLVKRGHEALTSVRNIPGQYRMTNKEAPTKPSLAISSILAPYATYVSRHSAVLGTEATANMRAQVVSIVIQRYSHLVADLLTTIKKTEDSLMRLKTKRKGAKPTPDSSQQLLPGVTLSDEDKIRLQLLLDVEELGNQLAAIGVDVGEHEAYQTLLEMVRQAERAKTEAEERPPVGVE